MDITKRFELLNIPSKGKYYKNGKSFLYVNFLTAHHEYILSSPMLMENGNGMDIVVSDVIAQNDWIKLDDMLWCDYQAVVIFLRAVTYGNEVEFSVECPNCSKNNSVQIKLNTLKFKDVQTSPGDDGFITFEIDNYNIKMAQPRRSDLISNEFGEFVYDDRDGRLNIGRNRTNALLACLVEINGIEDKVRMREVLLNMPKKIFDILYFLVEQNKIGFEKKYEHTCNHCSHDFEFNFDIGVSFLQLPESYQLGIEEECFLLAHYEGGTSIEEATNMPAIRRKFMIHRLEKELKKKHEKEQAEISKIKSRSKK